MRSYGIDLREHTLAAYARGEGSIRDVAEQFGVAPRTLVNWLALARTTGAAMPRPHGGGAHAKLTNEHLQVLLGLLRADLDATLPQLAKRLAQVTGCVVDRSTIGRALSAAGVTRKKRPPRDRTRSAGCSPGARGVPALEREHSSSPAHLRR